MTASRVKTDLEKKLTLKRDHKRSPFLGKERMPSISQKTLNSFPAHALARLVLFLNYLH